MSYFLIGKRSLPAFKNLAAISVLTEDALKFSLGGKLFLPGETTPEWERPFMDV